MGTWAWGNVSDVYECSIEVFPTAASPVTTTLTVGTGLAACPGEDALGEAPVRGILLPAPAAAILLPPALEHERAPPPACFGKNPRRKGLGRGAVRGEERGDRAARWS